MRFLLLFLCVSPQLFSQNVDFDKGSTSQKKYFEEIRYELVKDKIIVPVTINGQVFRFLLDTGAPNIISKRLFDALGLVESTSLNINDANNLTQSMHATEIPNLKIGTLNFKNQIALIYDIHSNNLLSCYNIDGFIGSNLFRKSILKVSPSQQKIYITNNVKNLSPKTKPSKMELVGSQKAPYVKFNFVGKNNNKASELVLIDTGMDGYYDMANLNFNYFSESGIFEIVGESTGVSGIGIFGAGPSNLQRLLKVENAIVNTIVFKNLIIETTDDMNSRIGLAFLDHSDLILDFKHKEVYFETRDTVLLEDKVPKYIPTMIDNKFVIGMVWDQNLAKSMTSGDEIISIDSKKVNELSPCEIMDLRSTFKNKTNYTIEIKNKENKIVSLKIEN
ncbi:retropepsin-like aspartic protease [Flavobacterium tegetincola]|uniref:retropepsin-like aspartic protease n=1 Tax=Flavobacterium tegetincola TaxID=150172 RepID=UPI0004279B7C|nr:retropepsin-like aspartic protease [Flavobacterium tegetincola]